MEANCDTLLKHRAVIAFLHAKGVVCLKFIIVWRCKEWTLWMASNVRRGVRKATLSNKSKILIYYAPRSGHDIIITNQ